MNWQARWIWSPGEAAPRNFYWCVRKEFQLSRGFSKVTVAISADTRYILWFNGALIGYGPIRSFYGHWYYDLHDVTEYACEGLNAIAVLVHHVGIGTFQNDYVRGRGRGGLIAQVEADGRVVAATDSSWLNVPHPAYERATARMSCQLGFDEYYDARRDLGEWMLPRYDDYDWNEAVEVGEAGCEPWGELHPRPIPFLTLEPVPPKVVDRVRVVKPPLAAWAFDLKPILAPDELSANPRTLSGVVATEIRAEAPCTLLIGDAHHGLRDEDVRLNGEVAPKEGGLHRLQLQAGSNLLTIDVSRWYHDWYRYLFVEADGEPPIQFVNPLIERADYPWVVLGPFEGDTEGYLKARNARTVAEIRHHPKAYGIDPLHAAHAALFALTTRAKPLPEAPRVEQTYACTNATDFAVIHPPKSGDVELRLDWQREVFGYVELELEAPAGVAVDFNGFEYVDPVLPDRVQWTVGLNNTFRYITRQGWQRFRSAVKRGFRYATLTFRFPSGATEPVRLRSVRCIHSVYPYEARGAFACSDPLLNQIYEMARETVRLCSEDTFIDCPTYEQTFWVGDARNEALFAYVGFGEYALARRCLLLAAQSLKHSPLVESQVPSAWENILTAWALLWAIACYEHYLFTGDEAFVREVFPYIAQQNQNLHERYLNAEGLLEISAWNMLDWAPMDTPNEGVVSHQNMWLVRVWETTAHLAEVAGEPMVARTWRRWAEELRNAINARLWNDAKRAYTDCLKRDGSHSTTYSIQTQVVALLCDVPTPERRAILEGYLSQPPADFVRIGSPFMTAFLLEVLFQLNRRAEILQR
ncbi:MAG: alpha-L-rhamnosidase N-terminal domain-containing protein, partial [Armatimonadota bacterium]|nr:alpha-L-rhamnosidase N-terminal domain-containing protein [Armatimonadota bacterium]